MLNTILLCTTMMFGSGDLPVSPDLEAPSPAEDSAPEAVANTSSDPDEDDASSDGLLEWIRCFLDIYNGF